MTELDLWLYPLVLGALIGIVSALRAGVSWSIFTVLQLLIVLSLGVLGLLGFQKENLTVIGWAIFAVITIYRQRLISGIAYDISLLKTADALSKANNLKLVCWDKPAKFWTDMILMAQAYIEGNRQEAETYFQRWQKQSTPRSIKDILATYKMIGHLYLRDWDEVAAEFEKHKQVLDATNTKKSLFPYQAAMAAARAYSEKRDFKNALLCLKLADLPMPGGSKDSVDTIFLSLFALSGDIKTCREILDRLATIKGALPSYARSFWLGRCYAAADEKTQALSLFQEAMDSAPENAPAWKERIAFYIERIDQECAALSGHPADPETISQARALLRRNLLMGSVLDPGKKSPAVLALCISFAMVMLIMEGSNFGLHSSLGDLHLIILASGALEGHAVLPNGNLSSIASGDWWRLLSYQFIHANITHLLMNMFGLFWLGKNVERVFGSAWFVFIFLVSGILSGLLQLLITPELVAVGASGSVLGVFGAGIAATIRLKDVYSPRLRNAELKWMIGFAVFQIIFDQVVNVLANLSDRDGPGMRIASFTHLGGMISGFLLGMICPLQVKISDSDQASDYQS